MKKIILFIVIVLVAAVVFTYIYISSPYNGDEIRIFIPKESSEKSIRDTLTANLGKYGEKVYTIWHFLNDNISESYGSYVINQNEKAINIANRIAKGRQTPVRLTINVARTLPDLVEVMAKRLEANPEELMEAMDSILGNNAEFAKKASYTGAFIPDTYNIYWNERSEMVIESLLGWRNKFWNEERLAKAKSIGLSPLEVTILASIVEEESNKSDEQPVIARLYLNRIRKGMKLQADPTVKFAIGDFSLRRITGKHLNIDSPYNTYKVAGLPPGPIRIPQKATIDAVLNAPQNDYLYMCAKEDFSGYHNFAKDYDTHLKNARKYTEELNKRGIR